MEQNLTTFSSELNELLKKGHIVYEDSFVKMLKVQGEIFTEFEVLTNRICPISYCQRRFSVIYN